LSLSRIPIGTLTLASLLGLALLLGAFPAGATSNISATGPESAVQAAGADVQLLGAGEDCATGAVVIASAFAARGVTTTSGQVATGSGLAAALWWPIHRCLTAVEGGRAADVICGISQQPWWVPTGMVARKLVRHLTGGQINVCRTRSQGGGGYMSRNDGTPSPR
jgi:hypothetical protein